jgi:TPR repeat protein
MGMMNAAGMRRAAVPVLALGLAGPAAAGDWQNAMAAYKRGDYATEFRLLKPLAEQGWSRAQYSLGIMYVHGQGMPKDYGQAVRWYRLAADQGDARAQNDLGVMYHNGEGVPEDDAQAVKWYRLAADKGYARAQNNLGVMYGTGWGVPTDYVLAYMWSNLGAAGGSTDAEENLDWYTAHMTRADISEAQRLSREWKPK